MVLKFTVTFGDNITTHKKDCIEETIKNAKMLGHYGSMRL